MTSQRLDQPAPAVTGTPCFRPWHIAWQDALYGRDGFYTRQTGAPARHFRTAAHASPLLARRLARLARRCGLSRVVDMGSGSGELLNALSDVAPDLELVGVDVRPRPASLARSADWRQAHGGASLTDLPLDASLVVAHEWLDDVPCPVLQVAGDGGWRQVEVTRTGEERLGAAATAPQQAWLERWWPPQGPGARAELGLPRDQAWAGLVQRAGGSVLLAVDYTHELAARPAAGSLSGYRHGRVVPAVPDGTCDVTAHVALDAVAAAGASAGASGTVLTSQRAALRALGAGAQASRLPSAHSDPAAYLAHLQRRGAEAELVDPSGLGSFGWLLQSRGPSLPVLG